MDIAAVDPQRGVGRAAGDRVAQICPDIEQLVLDPGEHRGDVIAELGVMGVLCVVALAAIFFSRKWLPPVYFLILIVASGTVLVQATLVLAAVVGALDRERGMLSTKAALPTT